VRWSGADGVKGREKRKEGEREKMRKREKRK